MRPGTALIYTGPPKPFGVTRDELVEALHQGRVKYSSIFNYPPMNCANIGAVGWPVYGAAIMNQERMRHTSYGPYARAMVRVCKEESFHQPQGWDIMMKMAAEQGVGPFCAIHCLENQGLNQ